MIYDLMKNDCSCKFCKIKQNALYIRKTNILNLLSITKAYYRRNVMLVIMKPINTVQQLTILYFL